MAKNSTFESAFVFCNGNHVIYTIMPVFLPFIFLGIVGNVLVVRIVLKNKEMRTATNLLLTNISISDFFYLLVELPVNLSFSLETSIYKYKIRGFYIARIMLLLRDVYFVISMSTVTVLARERYRALFYALQPQRRLEKRGIKRIIGLMWILSFLFHLPFYVTPQDFTTTKTFKNIIVITYCLLFSVLPSMFTIYYYGRIIIGICISKTICGQGEGTVEENESKKKTVKMLLLVTVIVVISKFPFPIMVVSRYQNKEQPCMFELIWTSTCIASCLTPLVYFTMCEKYRNGLKRLFQCCSLRSTNVTSTE